MKMNKMFAGLIAFVAGVALSAGSAAADGYMTGDPAMMKLVPYYETGDTRATIIGIQNMSMQEQETIKRNTLVSDIRAFIAGDKAVTKAALDAIDAARKTLDISPITLKEDETMYRADHPDTVEATAKALEDAEALTYKESLIVTVNAYDTMGMMMGSAVLCLAENQFGYVVLQDPADMGMDGLQGAVLSVMDEDIAASGYVKVMAGETKYQACIARGSVDPAALKAVSVTTEDKAGKVKPGSTEVATWTIIQDTGMGFFGTEVPTATISMESRPGADGEAGTEDDGDPQIACYSNPGDKDASNQELPYAVGDFMESRCGLIPEISDTKKDVANSTAYARYDAGDDSMVYVWLAAGGDTEDTKPSVRRMLDVTVHCPDGTMVQDADIDGVAMAIAVPAPDMITMIDPTGDDLGDFTDMCEGDRGTLKITMPDGSHAGMVFTHITQMMGHYRMNFQGYSMTPTDLK